MINIIKQSTEATINVKGSKFIGYTFNVTNKNEIDAILHQMKKEHYKATHICYAYRIGKENITEFSTDSGEPSGTAGKPILGAILRHNLTEILLAVVRYFGGTKLGVRGLIDAYSETAECAIKSSKIISQDKYEKVKVELNYTFLSSFEHQIKQKNMPIILTVYNENVTFTIGIKSIAFDNEKSWLDDLLGTKQILYYNCLGEDWIDI